MEILTPDNIQLSQPTNALVTELPSIATDCSAPSYLEFVQNNLAPATHAAYCSDIRMYEAAGGKFPATPEQIATYLADQCRILAPASLERRLIAVSKAHDVRGLINPVRTDLVRATMRGIKRKLGTAQRQAAPLLKEHLLEILSTLGNRPKDIRDAAILMIGFAGAFRRSELVALNCEDVERVRQGIVVKVHRSKTDQTAKGRKIGIRYARSNGCPVATLELWLERSKITHGPLFRRVDRHGKILDQPLSSEAISMIVKERIAAIGIDWTKYSAHSLRAGFVTSAVISGVSTWAICKVTGHRSDNMLGRYVRDTNLFSENSANERV